MSKRKKCYPPEFKVGDLVRFRKGYGPWDTLVMVTRVGSDGIYSDDDDPTPTLSHNLVRYWHPKYGDGGWITKNSIEVVSEVELAD
jgi:hypothetical protein